MTNSRSHSLRWPSAMLGVKLEFGRVAGREVKLAWFLWYYWHLSLDHGKINFPLMWGSQEHLIEQWWERWERVQEQHVCLAYHSHWGGMPTVTFWRYIFLSWSYSGFVSACVSSVAHYCYITSECWKLLGHTKHIGGRGKQVFHSPNLAEPVLSWGASTSSFPPPPPN